MSESLEFKFGIDDHQVAFSHFMLSDLKTALKIRDAMDANGRSLKNNRDEKFIATVFIEGVQIDADIIQMELKRWYSGLEEKIRAEFSPEGFEKRVEEEVKKRIKDRADGVIELLDSLRDKLQDSDDLIKPHWER